MPRPWSRNDYVTYAGSNQNLQGATGYCTSDEDEYEQGYTDVVFSGVEWQIPSEDLTDE